MDLRQRLHLTPPTLSSKLLCDKLEYLSHPRKVGTSNSIFVKERACPVCEHGKVQASELPSQSECSYCHKLIEVVGFFLFAYTN